MQGSADATVLRGASAAVDVRRVGLVLAAAGLAALAVLVAALFWAGAATTAGSTGSGRTGCR